MATTDYKTVVKRVNETRQRQIYALLAVLLLLLLAVMFYMGFQQGKKNRVPLISNEAALGERIEKLEARAAIDETTLAQLRSDLASREQQVMALENELVFYRDIMSSGEDVSSVKVRAPELHWDPSRRVFDYRAVIQRLAPGDQFYRGELSVGLVDDQGQALSASEDKSEAGNHALAFKYFQRISGEIEVPDGFSPAGVTFAIELTSPRRRRFNDQLDWNETVVYGTQ